MLPIPKLLLALDATPDRLEVWAEGCALARRLGAELHLVHAVDDVEPRSPHVEGALQAAESRLLELLVAGLDAGTRVSPGVLVRVGGAAETIVRAARDLKVDLVVIGAGTRTSRDHVLLGFTAEQVLREAEAPVWVVRPGRDHARLERIVAAVDPERPQREVIHAAGLVARPERLGLTVLSVVPRGGRDGPVRERVRAAVAGTAAEGLDVEVYVREADKPAAELLDEAQRDAVDLLVLGERPRRGARRRHEGEVAEKLLRVVPCSILRVPAPP